MTVSRSYIRAWHALFILFVAGLAVSSYIHFGIQGYAISAQSLGRSLGVVAGSGFALIALPAIVVIPWRWAQRRRGATNAPIIVGVIVFLIFAFLSLAGAMGP